MLIGFLLGGWVWVPLGFVLGAALAASPRRRVPPVVAPPRPEPPTLWIWHPGHGRWVPTRYYAGDDAQIVRQLVGRT